MGVKDLGKSEPERQGIQSVEVGIRLLRALTAASGPTTLKDLAAAATMTASKAHRYLVSFARAGLVEQEPASGRYDLGPLALEIGLAALGRLDVVRLASRALPDLRDSLGESAFLAVWGNHGPTIIRWEESPRPVTVNVRVGSVLPLLNSATGRVFLTWLPPGQTAGLVRAETAGEPALAAAKYVVDETRAHGLGRVVGDLLPGVSALAAPVFDHQAQLAGVLTTLGAEGAFDAGWDGAIAGILRTEAARLSRRLGYAA